MTKHTRLILILLISCTIPVTACAGTTAQKTGPGPAAAPDYVPFGVYWSWPKTKAMAKYNGMSTKKMLNQLLSLVSKYHVDTIWCNIGKKDLATMAGACEKHNLRLLAHPWSLQIEYVHGVKQRSQVLEKLSKKVKQNVEKRYERLMPPLIKIANQFNSIKTWVITDEPQKGEFLALEQARKVIRRLDPTRMTLNVTQRKRTALQLKLTEFPVAVEDIYGLFAPTSPNGPNTDAAFTAYYRNRVTRFVDGVLAHGKVAWAMPQSFGQVRGPFKVNDQGHVTALPGSYAHWKMPSPAQIKWQAWEAIRAGAKGVIFFIATPFRMPNPKHAKQPPYHKDNFNFKPIQKPTDQGPSGLITPRGKATPQLIALGQAYARLAQVAPLIRHWKRIRAFSGLIHAETGFAVGAFRDPKTGATYLVVVNDDFDHTQTGTLKLPSGTTRVKDIITDKPLDLSANKTIEVKLPAGGGTILQLSK